MVTIFILGPNDQSPYRNVLTSCRKICPKFTYIDSTKLVLVRGAIQLGDEMSLVSWLSLVWWRGYGRGWVEAMVNLTWKRDKPFVILPLFIINSRYEFGQS
jgi:hypothetical protein